MNLILGAGITGLAAGIKTGYPIYEAGDKPGGICRSYYLDGYRFENGGGHWIFGDPEVKKFLLSYVSLNEFGRDASVYYNQFFNYPIQSWDEEGYYGSTLKGWLINKFGHDMCRMFFWPFNEKYTAGMFDEIIQDDPGKSPKSGNGYNSIFHYPSGCGLDVLVDKMAHGQDIRYGKKAVEVDLYEKKVRFSDGDIVEYDNLISTIPLNKFLRMSWQSKAEDLESTSVVVLNIGAKKGKRCPSSQWVYIPGPEKFFRVGFYSNVDPSFAKDGKVSIYVERAFTRQIEDIENYKKEVVEKLQEWHWIEEVDVCDPCVVDCAYTWLRPGHKRAEYLKLLETKGVKSIGRYGKWRFQGVCESIMDGLSL